MILAGTTYGYSSLHIFCGKKASVQSKTMPGRFCRKTIAENFVQVFWFDADAVVGDFDFDFLIVAFCDADF